MNSRLDESLKIRKNVKIDIDKIYIDKNGNIQLKNSNKEA
jgi:hypothetical protein